MGEAATPSFQEYVTAFNKIGPLTDMQVQMLRIHYYAPESTITATQMARAVGYGHYAFANAQYGRIASLMGEQLDYNPASVHLGTLVVFEKRNGEWHWILRPEVARALETLGWVEDTGLLPPEEIAAPTILFEGDARHISTKVYSRNPEARRRCIEHYGANCWICGISFGAVYGKVAEGYIQIHHLRPLSETTGEHAVVPVEDLLPVCPNCHAVLHLRKPAYSVEEVRALLQQQLKMGFRGLIHKK